MRLSPPFLVAALALAAPLHVSANRGWTWEGLKHWGPPPPPPPADDVACRDGGTNCLDYSPESCNFFQCNTHTKKCENQRIVGGTLCNDYNDCTDNDRCVEFDNGNGVEVVCRGTAAVNRPCEDNNPCTTNDVCIEENQDGVCRGTPSIGAPCTDSIGSDCNTANTCQYNNDGFVACVPGPVAVGTPCNDYNDCTEHDQCVEFDYDGGVRGECRGTPFVGGSCDDGNECTTDDRCMFGETGDYTFCNGIPVQGTPCTSVNSCTVDDVCALNDQGEPFCADGTPTVGAICGTGNDREHFVCVNRGFGVLCDAPRR